MTRTIRDDQEGTTINTSQGIAAYSHSEIEDKNERWDDHWLTTNGEYVIHEGTQHHVYLLNRSD